MKLSYTGASAQEQTQDYKTAAALGSVSSPFQTAACKNTFHGAESGSRLTRRWKVRELSCSAVVT